MRDHFSQFFYSRIFVESGTSLLFRVWHFSRKNVILVGITMATFRRKPVEDKKRGKKYEKKKKCQIKRTFADLYADFSVSGSAAVTGGHRNLLYGCESGIFAEYFPAAVFSDGCAADVLQPSGDHQ